MDEYMETARRALQTQQRVNLLRIRAALAERKTPNGRAKAATTAAQEYEDGTK